MGLNLITLQNRLLGLLVDNFDCFESVLFICTQCSIDRTCSITLQMIM